MARDKFAAMASRAAAAAATAAAASAAAEAEAEAFLLEPHPEIASTDPLDPLDATGPSDATPAESSTAPSPMEMEPAKESSQPPQLSTADTPPVAAQRDKLAALASRNNRNPEASASDDAAPSVPPSSPGGDGKAAAPEAATTCVTSEGDGASSTAAEAASPSPRPEAPRGGSKLAAMAASSAAAMNRGSGGPRGPPSRTAEERAAAAVAKRKEHLDRLQERLSKRGEVLANLDRAEEMTCRLLKIAAQTTDALQDLSCSPDLSRLSEAYRSTLQALHPLLASGGTQQLIQPYQNHTKETKQSMYAARVEMRLELERLDLLKTFTELEREEAAQPVNTVEPASSKPDASEETGTEPSSRKRPREEETNQA